MHNTTPNNIYNRNRRILIISLLIGFIILVAVILIVSIYYLRRSATLDILVAPTSATITIDGQTYTNGTYKIEPTSTSATITAEGFTSQEVSLNIIGGETTTLYLYLIPTDGDMNWYLDHPDDMMIVTQIGDLQALATSDAYHTEHPISQVLPIVVVEVNPTTYDWTEFRIDGGSYSTSGGTLLYAQNADVTINGGVFRNTGSSHSVTARGSTVLRVTGGAVINENAESTAAVFNLADSSVAQIYDGYFYNGGKGRALTTEGTSAAAMQEIALYGGSFVVTATGTCVRSDDSLRPLAIYGGSYFNYGGDWATAGSCTLHGGYLFAVKALNSSGSVTGDNAARNADGSLMMMDGLYCRLADGVPDTKTGASARLVEGSNGIRFESVIPKAALDYAESLKDAGTEITYGTVYENIPGVEGVSTDEEGNVTLRAALVNLQTENIGRDFSAVSYLSYVRDGATVYLYGLYLEADHSRSMAQVAESALADVKAQADAVYQYEYNGAFSPYTEAQRAVLEGYLDAVAE